MQTRPQVGKKVQKNYRRLHLPVDALAQNMFSHDVKRLRFWYQTLKFSHPINVKFPRQSFAVITVKNVRQICENPFTDISRAGKASGTQDFFREVGEDLFYMTVNHKRTVVGTSHLGGKTSKFDTRNAHVRRHLKTCFVRQYVHG